MFSKLRKFVIYLLDLPKSIYINFRILPFRQALRLPITVSHNCVLRGIKKGSIIFKGKLKTGAVSIGVGTGTRLGSSSNKSYIILSPGAKLIFNGQCGFASGCSIIVKENATLQLGDKFSANFNCSFLVFNHVSFGDNCFLGWNVSVRDGDGHYIIDATTKEILNHSKPISVGNNTWICSDVVIMKGVSVSDNCVVACNSLVTKNLDIENSIYGGNPIRILKSNIEVIRDGTNYN